MEDDDEQANSKEKEKLVDDLIDTKFYSDKVSSLALDMKRIVLIHQLFSFFVTFFYFYRCKMVYMLYITLFQMEEEKTLTL